MVKMTPELEFKILQQCSHFFLAQGFPDDWKDTIDWEQDAFIEENVWHPLEGRPATEVYTLIEDAAEHLTMFLVEQGFVKEQT